MRLFGKMSMLRDLARPDRRAAAPKTCSPSYFLDYLSRRWAEGCGRGRELLHEIKLRGYTGSFSHLERLLAKWRRARGAKAVTLPPAPRADDESADADDRYSPSCRRSRDWVVYLANRRGIIVYQVARIVDARTGSKGRRSEKCVAGFHNHASARHAIPRHPLVNRIFARVALEDETIAYARAVAENAPMSVRAAKFFINQLELESERQDAVADRGRRRQ